MAIPAIRQWPMLRVFVPFAIGICLQYYLPLPAVLLYSAFLAAITVAIGYGLAPSKLQFRLSIHVGILMICFAGITGMLAMYLKERNSGYNNAPGDGKLLIRLVEDPMVRGKIQKATAELVEHYRGNNNVRISGLIQVTCLIDSAVPLLTFGQQLLITKGLDTIPDNSNPGGFNFQEYSRRQGIRHQVFLTKDDYIISGIQVSSLDKFLASIRRFILSTIRTNIKGKEEAGLAEALLIGYKNDLDKGLVQSYSNTGVVHVIAISGLHLALIYWIIGRGCDLLKFHKKKVKPFVVISGLWIFALLAGASPSVIRSAVMFTVIVVGEMMRRKAHILNSLAASAFCLLCYNPYWLWDLGFQLSYIAVLSLVLYAKPINDAIYVRNPILSNLWSLVSVTLAAQILTTPLTLMNFHKFPLLFLFTNCICVPLSSLLLIGELALCSISWLHTAAGWVGIALLYGLKFMNSAVRFFEQYPISNFQPVQMSITQTIILYGVIALSMHSLVNKNARSVFVAIVCFTAFSGLRMVSFYQADQQSRLVIYNVPGKMAVDLFEGRAGKAFQYSGQRLSVLEVNQHLSNCRITHRFDPAQFKTHYISGNNVFSASGIRIGWVSGHSPTSLALAGPVDILVVSNNALVKSMSAINGLKLRMVIADATNSRAALQQYRRFFQNKNIPYHSVNEQGAFVRNLN